MNRVAIYARVSTSDKGQDTENQLRELREFVSNKTTEGWTLAGEYVDQASGKSANRPEFQRLFRDAAERRFDLVLFWSLDRFSREGVVETLQHLERLKANGVSWWSFKEEFQYLEERKPHTAERTNQLERNLLRPLRKFLGEKVVMRIRAEEIAAYQRERRTTGISGRTLNMEIGVLRQIMKRGKVWSIVSEDVKLDREGNRPIAKVLTEPQKRFLFETAASKDEWLVAYCAAVLAANTTCRGIELKHLRWSDVDLMEREIVIRRSKTQAGHRTIPINVSAMAALARLRRRDEALGSGAPDHYVFPACERNKIDPTKPQKTWRTAWRSLVEETATRASDKAAKEAEIDGTDIETVRKKARRPFIADDGTRLRFHDLRHQAITELSEGGASDATMMALAGHMSREMLEHYSHVRMAAKRTALDRLGDASPHAADVPSDVMSQPTSQKLIS